jgi:hypothetical protein
MPFESGGGVAVVVQHLPGDSAGGILTFSRFTTYVISHLRDLDFSSAHRTFYRRQEARRTVHTRHLGVLIGTPTTPSMLLLL